MKNITLIFCTHPLDNRKVDEDYEDELIAAQAEGFDTLLFDYDDMMSGTLRCRGKIIEGTAIYRGWMMTPENYENFYASLLEKGLRLINTPQQYRNTHLLPGWYDKIYPHTPKSRWTTDRDVRQAVELRKRCGGDVIVKDYVKSRKHEWYEACFIPKSHGEAEARKVIENFVERQGEDLIGGIVVREYVPLKAIGFHDKSASPVFEEYRAVILYGKILTVTPYWHMDEYETKDELTDFVAKQSKVIDSPFFTMDVAVTENGDFCVIEIGDAQVSGLQEENPKHYYHAMRAFVTEHSCKERYAAKTRMIDWQYCKKNKNH